MGDLKPEENGRLSILTLNLPQLLPDFMYQWALLHCLFAVVYCI